MYLWKHWLKELQLSELALDHFYLTSRGMCIKRLAIYLTFVWFFSLLQTYFEKWLLETTFSSLRIFGAWTHIQTYKRLSSIYEERSEAYANANARVSLESKWCRVSVLSLLFPFQLSLACFRYRCELFTGDLF